MRLPVILLSARVLKPRHRGLSPHPNSQANVRLLKTTNSMTGSRPNQLRSAKRRRAGKPLTPWSLISTLFILYGVVGLLLSVPEPPYWIWVPAILGMLLLILGFHRPANALGRKFDPAGWLSYLGGLLLVIAVAIGANYIGGKSLEGMSFWVAVLGLAGFTLLSVVLTAAAAIVGAAVSTRLMQFMSYGQSLSVVMSTCIFGLCFGGLTGFSTLILTR